MALPKQSAPIYNAIVPSSKQEIKFRPFLVKEEKTLLIAQQSNDPQVMLDTLKGIIKNCVRTDLDVEKLALFDVEYLFCQIRAKSVGEMVEMVVMCDKCPEEETKARVKLTFDLTKLEVQFPEGHESKIELFDDVGVIMKYPTLATLKELEKVDQNSSETLFKVIIKMIDCIYDSEQVYMAKDQTEKELVDFLENLTQDQFKKLQNFFVTMPKLSKSVEYDCPVCSHHHEKVVEGLGGFFQ